ncbi:hypothetical protein N801_09870 [Knoellia aerolata DSM 18566]|uniref:YibE/F family protein n=2 Tax=Knoellia TaxID=136099 RepID=A0A0A0JUE4_9MICO|nr:hypothetical protein N801_09870 [Knoellia aerolata DSM 18566]
MRRLAVAVIVPIAIATLAALVWLWPSDGVAKAAQESGGEQLNGRVISAQAEPCPEGQPAGERCGTLRVRLGQGADSEVVETPLPSGPGAPPIAEGEDVVVLRFATPEGAEYAVVDHQRARPLWVLAIAFTLALAYAGSSLPLLILIVSSDNSLGGALTDQVIAQEIARSAVATLGLVAAVPIMTLLAALTQKRVQEQVPAAATG